MKVCVRLFAVARQLAGRDQVSLDLSDGATIADLRQRLGAEVPQLASILPQVVFAVAAEYADDRTSIPSGAEVACIPPVSGG